MDFIQKEVIKLNQQLKRGTLTLAVLSQLHKRQYGYSLVTILQHKGVEIEPSTLYPLLRRLEKQGLLQSEWETSEPRPRKYYFLTEIGKEVLHLLEDEWEKIVTSMDTLLKDVD